MNEAKKSFPPKKPSRATARSVLGEIPLSWEQREVDIEGIRRFFIHLVAQASVEQLKSEDQHGKRIE